MLAPLGGNTEFFCEHIDVRRTAVAVAADNGSALDLGQK
jgi:hypothetical protein